MKGIFSRLAWFIPVRKWRDGFREFFNPIDEYILGIPNKCMEIYVKNKYMEIRNKCIEIYVKNKYKNYIIINHGHGGFGEHIVLGIYIKEFKKIHRKKVLVLVRYELKLQMLKELCPDIDAVLLFDDDLIRTQLSNYPLTLGVDDKEFYHKTMKERYLDDLNLPLDTKPSIIDIVPSDKILKLFNSYGFKKDKTILISLHANSLSENFDVKEWRKIAMDLTQKGFNVVFNTPAKDFYGYKTLFLSVKETLEFISLCGYFIGYRSGFCDVLASHLKNTRSFIFYPILNNSSRTRNTFEYFNLSSNFDNKNTKEVIYTDFPSLQNDIKNYF